MKSSGRLWFFDNLRVLCMAMVVAHHAAQPYGPTGGEWPIMETVRAAVLGPFFMVNRSFGMSLFFMIAGYFTVMSCDRSGPRAFLKSRLLRLGIPLLVASVVLLALQVFWFGAVDGKLGPAYPLQVAHLWFIQHLLIYSLVYGLWRLYRPRREQPDGQPARPPRARVILAAALGLALVTAIVRIWWGVDDWVKVLGYLAIAPGDVPRDLALFVVGGLAYRHNWATRFSARAGMAWLGVGLFLAALWYAWALWLWQLLEIPEPWIGLVHAIWESMLCLAMCIGLTVLFRERANVTSRLLRWLSDAQYAAYIFHVFVVLAFQALLLGTALPPLVKFGLVTLAAVPVSFLVGGLVRKPLRL